MTAEIPKDLIKYDLVFASGAKQSRSIVKSSAYGLLRPKGLAMTNFFRLSPIATLILHPILYLVEGIHITPTGTPSPASRTWSDAGSDLPFGSDPEGL